MKERPILFSGPMVRAILEGRKTQTRRMVKFSVLPNDPQCHSPWKTPSGWQDCDESLRCPYGQPGDRLWVRETFGIQFLSAMAIGETQEADYAIYYAAGGRKELSWSGPRSVQIPYDKMYNTQRGEYRPSIHMPRWASRITLEVVSVRVERLQDISPNDCYEEGVESVFPDMQKRGLVGSQLAGPNAYREIWESINGPGSWDANPWVWVVEFKRIDKDAP